MKYWLLFTLRTLARAGLALAVLCWWLSGSRYATVAGSYAPKGLVIRVHPCGWNVTHVQYLLGPPDWSFESKKISDPADWVTHFYNTVPEDSRLVPGLYYGPGNRSGTLFVAHWFLCLVLLIATIATSVKWRRKVKEATGADV